MAARIVATRIVAARIVAAHTQGLVWEHALCGCSHALLWPCIIVDPCSDDRMAAAMQDCFRELGILPVQHQGDASYFHFKKAV